MHPDPVIRLKPGNRQVRALFDELEEFLKNPRAADILLGEWLHDEILPPPSPELLEYFALDIFYGDGKYDRFLKVGSELTTAIRKYITDQSGVSENSRWNSVFYALARRRILELGGASGSVLHWQPALLEFLSGESEIPIVDAGRRRLSRFFIEAMTSRAVFMQDVPRLESLVDVVRSNRNGRIADPQVADGLALQLLGWHSHLTQRMGRNPSNRELEIFLQNVYPDITIAKASWSAAHKLLDLPRFSLQGKKIDEHLIVNLALKARRTGPKATKVPSWRKGI